MYSFHILYDDIWTCFACKQSGDLSELRRLGDDRLRLTLEQVGKEPEPQGLVIVGEYLKPKQSDGYATGFNLLDRMIGGLIPGMLTVMTGKRAEGKSTFVGQMALNLVNDDIPVCFYSGELNASTFQSWIVTQAAGKNFLEQYTDKFGEIRYTADQWAEQRIKAWLGKKLILYDGSVSGVNAERNTIMDRFSLAHKRYGCKVFVVDNLMTARVEIDHDRDFYRAQSNFVRDLLEFAVKNDVHVVLIAHPRKNDMGDKNDNISGSADITNLAHNVMRVAKTTEQEKKEYDCESIIEVTKNRQWGDSGAIRMNFDKPTRRFIALDGTQTTTYGWEG